MGVVFSTEGRETKAVPARASGAVTPVFYPDMSSCVFSVPVAGRRRLLTCTAPPRLHCRKDAAQYVRLVLVELRSIEQAANAVHQVSAACAVTKIDLVQDFFHMGCTTGRAPRRWRAELRAGAREQHSGVRKARFHTQGAELPSQD